MLLTRLVEEGDKGGEGDPRACYSLAVLLSARLQQKGGAGGAGGGRGQGKGDVVDGREAERVYTLLRRAVKGGVLPAVHNLANLLAQGQG